MEADRIQQKRCYCWRGFIKHCHEQCSGDRAVELQRCEAIIHYSRYFTHSESAQRTNCPHVQDGCISLEFESMSSQRWASRDVLRMRPTVTWGIPLTARSTTLSQLFCKGVENAHNLLTLFHCSSALLSIELKTLFVIRKLPILNVKPPFCQLNMLLLNKLV